MKCFVCCCLILITSHALGQPKSYKWMIGAEIGSNNLALKAIQNKPNLEASTAKHTAGVAVQYLVSKKWALGLSYCRSEIDLNFDNGLTQLHRFSYAECYNVSAHYFYLQHPHFQLGSGLELGLFEFSYLLNGKLIAHKARAITLDVVDARYSFNKHFGLKGNIYLGNGHNTTLAAGVFVKF